MAKPRDHRRAALGLPDAAQVAREWRQAHPEDARALDKQRRWAFYERKNKALIEAVWSLSRSTLATFGGRRHVGKPKGKVEAIVAAIRRGEKLEAIAQEHGLSARTVARYKKKYMTG